jgi:dihydropteroate synthase
MNPSTILPPDRVTIVGVLNVTPDSFSDGGRFVRGADVAVDRAVAEARQLVAAGADWVDVGGESTRPGAEPVSEGEEIARTRPVIEALAKDLDTVVSIDTRKAAVAEAALEAGARVVNDVSGMGHEPEIGAVAARFGAGLVLGHLRGQPSTMQESVAFDDVLAEVTAELAMAVELALRAGMEREELAVDPGIGFGKELEHNLALLAGAGRLGEALGLPVLVGPSRKSFLGRLTGDPVESRDIASHAACAVGVFAGADAVRVHDVAGAVRAVAVARALRGARGDSH